MQSTGIVHRTLSRSSTCSSRLIALHIVRSEMCAGVHKSAANNRKHPQAAAGAVQPVNWLAWQVHACSALSGHSAFYQRHTGIWTCCPCSTNVAGRPQLHGASCRSGSMLCVLLGGGICSVDCLLCLVARFQQRSRQCLLLQISRHQHHARANTLLTSSLHYHRIA